MIQNQPPVRTSILPWQRNLLSAAAIFSVLLIAMGGVLCVTHSIRSCPDWPGCFGKIIPPLETSPILEYTHRVLAASTGLLVFASAIMGALRTRRLRWILIPTLAASVLVVEVSIFGALAVLHGLAPGWAAVDLGSALLVVALMVATAVLAQAQRSQPVMPVRLSFHPPYARLALVTLVVVYGVFVSGVLVAGANSFSSCLGWPVYSAQVFQADLPGAGNSVRLVFSVVGIGLIAATLVQAWRSRRERPAVFRMARWVLAFGLIEALVQGLLLGFGFKVGLLVVYTISAAGFWGLLVALGVTAGLEEVLRQPLSSQNR